MSIIYYIIYFIGFSISLIFINVLVMMEYKKYDLELEDFMTSMALSLFWFILLPLFLFYKISKIIVKKIM